MKTEQEIAQVLEDASFQCEDANFHDRVGMPERLYSALVKFVPPKHRLKLAQEISKELTAF